MSNQKLKYYHSSDKQDWGTPQYVFDTLHSEFKFTIDVCANAENAKCERYFTEESDGLLHDWTEEICFMNPPYNRVSEFMEKAWKESRQGATVVCLVPFRSDSKWWHLYALKTERRVFVQRLEFEGHKKNRSPFQSAIVIFRPPEFKEGVFRKTRKQAREEGYKHI
jgi:phage N-6-adenine-methyltransferase